MTGGASRESPAAALLTSAACYGGEPCMPVAENVAHRAGCVRQHHRASSRGEPQRRRLRLLCVSMQQRPQPVTLL
eukprot:CAMPEP_0174712514 /NCGR_PEP_ID=MMETSP1094-20130205/13482_1 /TAXON_ID=156173 /ORGANISM="Chrysochromulina brevifilum, Strain UTEX LB 985" /LENGTH=74 /DNA_ID=CAMNT_0015911589 /DNA_START=754 /DNA_END=979 /DNA_ORIENTATION=-